MLLQIAAILWTLVGFFTGSVTIFLAGGVACIAIDIIKLSIRQLNITLFASTYIICYMLFGEWEGLIFASIILNTIDVIIPRAKEMAGALLEFDKVD